MYSNLVLFIRCIIDVITRFTLFLSHQTTSLQKTRIYNHEQVYNHND